MSKPLAALATLAGLLHAGDAAADVFYPTLQYQTVTPPPPLRTGASAPPASANVESGVEVERPPGPVSSRELVEVAVGADGTPVRVTATQRLRVDFTGDYSFVVPAPATRVVRGPGSESLPGLRDAGIVWQGFANRHRVLSARAALRPRAAAGGLPLRLRLQRRAGSTVVRLASAARRRLPLLSGGAPRAGLAVALGRLRARATRLQATTGLVPVHGRFGAPSDVEMAAPLRVTGTISQGTSQITVDERLGGGRPLERTLLARGMTSPTLRLRVELLRPAAILPTVRELAAAPHPLSALQAALGAAAISRAYDRYLDTPDPLGPSEASYVFSSAPRPAAAATPPARLHDDGGTPTVVLVGLLAAAGVAGLAAVWARS